MRKLTCTAVLTVLFASSACSFTYRAERELNERVELGEESSLWIELADAPDRISPAPEGENALWVQATIEALGGTEAVASAHARDAEIVSESLGDTLRVFAHWPAEAEGLTSMRTEGLRLPRGVPTSLLLGAGHVDAGLVTGDLDMDLGAGDITVTQGEADLSLRTGSGAVDVTVLAAAAKGGYDVVAQSGYGPVHVNQEGEGAIYVEALDGDVEISVESDDDLDIYVLAGGAISVNTQNLSIDEPYGEWTQTLGEGTQALVAIAYNGQVTISEH